LQIEGAGYLPAGVCRIGVFSSNINSIRHDCNSLGAFADSDLDWLAGMAGERVQDRLHCLTHGRIMSTATIQGEELLRGHVRDGSDPRLHEGAMSYNQQRSEHRPNPLL
jgi:hypothetical protein